MTIAVHVPAMLRNTCGNERVLSLEATSVRAALQVLERDYPRLYGSVCEETGAVRRHVNLFVNTSNVRDGRGLDTELVNGDVLTIMAAVSGGATWPNA